LAAAGSGLRKREGVIAVIASILVVLGLLTVFATQLADTQAKSRRDVEARVHERGVLAAALIDSLFSSVLQQVPQYARLYGGSTVSTSTLSRNRLGNPYLALLDASGGVLAASAGFTSQARADLPRSAALRLVAAGRPYAIGDVLPYGRTGVLNLAVRVPTRHGTRILLTGIEPASVAGFINSDLRKIPGVAGSENYLVEGHGVVLGSTDPAVPAGRIEPGLARAGDRGGRYYDQVRLANSTWRIVLTAPDGPLFASVSGWREWVPWLIFAAFAAVAAVALALALRVLRASDQVRSANARLRAANRQLASMNQALDRRARELARSNSELEQFASIASHDLQEPLRKVRTYTQQLAMTEGDRLSEKGRDRLERADSAAERMQRLIDDLLRFARVSTHGRPFATVEMDGVVREALRDLELEIARAGASVTVGELPTVNGDELQMRQLMQNLISNALKFRRPGVRPEVRISASSAAEVTRIAVSDNGIGFEPQYASRIFRVFERLHGRSEYPGTGIGLALCRKIAERHGGTISAYGVPGEGATFTVTLPLNQPAEVLDEEPRPVKEEARVPA